METQTLSDVPQITTLVNSISISDNFPPELWVVIWYFLPIEEKGNCRLVCVEWQKRLDSIRDPHWWQHYLINLGEMHKLNDLALRWIEDHTKAISAENTRIGRLKYESWNVLTLNFATWLVDNLKHTESQYLVMLGAVSCDSKNLGLVKKIFKFVTPTISQMIDYCVCSTSGIFEECRVTVFGSPNNELAMAEFMAEKYDLVNSKCFELLVVACRNGDLPKFNCYFDQLARPLSFKQSGELWIAALCAKSTIMVDRLTQLNVINHEWDIVMTRTNLYHVSIIEWLMIKKGTLEQNKTFYITQIINLCTQSNATDEDFETLKRINKLVDNVDIPISIFVISALAGCWNERFGTWMLNTHNLYLDNKGKWNSADGFLRFHCFNLVLAKKAFELLNLRGFCVTTQFTPSEPKTLTCGLNILGTLYCQAPINVIEYLREEKFLNPNDLDNRELFAFIILHVDKTRLIWLYQNRPTPKLTISNLARFDTSCARWQTIKYLYDTGILPQKCEIMIITTLFKNLCDETSVRALEWCYQTFSYVREIRIRHYNIHHDTWIKNRILPEMIIASSSSSYDDDNSDISGDGYEVEFMDNHENDHENGPYEMF